MREVYGISLEGIAPQHLHQFDVYSNKSESVSRKKEVQSAKKFYLECPNTDEEGKLWKQIHAPSANISCLIATIKTLENVTDLRLHRICKTAYPLFVWMGHNKRVFKYLETFACFEITKQVGEVYEGNPFVAAKNQMQNLPYNVANLKYVCETLGRRLIWQGYKVSHVTTVLFNNSVLFTAISRKDAFGINEFKYSEEITKERKPMCSVPLEKKPIMPKINLPSIQILLNRAGLSMLTDKFPIYV